MIAPASAPDCLFIPLTQGQFACVDFDAPIEVFRHKWCARRVRTIRKFYAGRKAWSAERGHYTQLMHRVIADVHDRNIEVDHRDGNGLNNTRANLRPCTHVNNSRNRISRVGMSKFKGVSFRETQGWCASIRVNYVLRWLGTFASEEAAARAYDAAAIRYHGEYALPNFPVIAK